MKNILCITLVILMTVISGCATWKMKMEKNNENLMMLEMDMPKQEVIGIMGKPSFNEAYKSLNGKSVIILFYYTQRKWADGSETKDECTPVVFENGQLVGWGDEFYKAKMELDVNIKHQ